MTDPKLIQTFLAVAEMSSFSRAARLRNLSQPTVSQHVQRLEQALGAQLFERSSGGATLTDAGERLQRLAVPYDRLHQELTRFFGESRAEGRVRFGVAEDFANTQLPRMLRAFTRRNPDITLSLKVDEYAPIIEALKTEELDLVLVKQYTDALMRPFAGRTIAEDRLVWVMDADLELRPDEPLPLVTYRAPSITREKTTAALEKAGHSWTTACECQGTSGVVAALRGGLGIGVLPSSLVPRQLRQGVPERVLPDLGKVRFVLLQRPSLSEHEARVTAALADAHANTVLSVAEY